MPLVFPCPARAITSAPSGIHFALLFAKASAVMYVDGRLITRSFTAPEFSHGMVPSSQKARLVLSGVPPEYRRGSQRRWPTAQCAGTSPSQYMPLALYFG